MGSKVVNEDKITQVNIFVCEYCEHIHIYHTAILITYL